MSKNDSLANVLSHIINYERTGKPSITTKDTSKTIKEVLRIMNEKGYIGAYEETEDSKGNILTINLLGAINNCGVIKPRHSVTMNTYEKFEKRYLPSKGFGFLIVSTNKGLMTHEEAQEQNLGGVLISYCY